MRPLKTGATDKREIIMDKETVKHLWALRKANEVLIEGLKVAIFVLENGKELTPERRKSLIKSLKGLIAQSEEIYAEVGVTGSGLDMRQSD